ncbi:lipid A deacylase LpxR family protein [Vibrio sonorensis]|uniref:lipid A deacylase LpxR family protein n=1 Tax=Vibrio sonorensis TaxID=1004316 RepID=UPI0008DA3946|nr:lipid A-modifier LpxR family protein [Vibrio sonorensis]
MDLYRIIPLLLISASACASDKSTVAFSIDNDGIFGVDQDYTNGLFISYTSGGIAPWPMFKPLSLSFWGAASLDKVEFTLGHKMWTPSDIDSKLPVANDRPYAGFFHGELNYISLHPEQAQRFNLTIGMTGENSYADQAQNIVHGITGSTTPNGWRYQVDEGVVGSVGYLSHFNIGRINRIAGTELELSNVSEVNFGNFRSDISTGIMLRWGVDLGGNFGAANIDTENPFRAGMIGSSSTGWFVYGGIEARYRFNDVTLEGDRPALVNPQAYEVTLDNTQATAVAGFAWYNEVVGATLSATVKTPDYKESPTDIYGTGGLALYAFF